MGRDPTAATLKGPGCNPDPSERHLDPAYGVVKVTGVLVELRHLRMDRAVVQHLGSIQIRASGLHQEIGAVLA